MPASDTLSFLMAWAAAPLRVASVTPSSPSLAALMTREINADTGQVLELGPGTGPFTRALLARGVKEENLTLIEAGSDFASMLRHRFPDARVFEMDAVGLRHLALFEGPVLGAAISGLPFLSIPPRKTQSILEGVFANLRPGGALYQFTYSWRCPIEQTMLDRLDLEATRIGHTFRNFPPAAVYRISRIETANRYDWRIR
ncbi:MULTISPECIES: phospholipid methyltransferase [unclassified Mesorhizobium]|jgi:phosphatidylethanolamine/phosphatidyl-N-methylethanolamine N-methyltransferase|uniref:class I SAM-dependent methyltransferase n=1 Tax=unclassified Mesorhizobium TaxID=325217 RepID=UPI0008DF5691|nr:MULTISPECIES: phospholipid methyltransferase [unclassified Mesorhizobium]RJG46713.1 phospholipid methyltransferase [Mesorhizobium sp. DCY119]SFU17899.1 Phospholipid N-methyltransferase [Mesorhizobium sp. YR577]